MCHCRMLFKRKATSLLLCYKLPVNTNTCVCVCMVCGVVCVVCGVSVQVAGENAI
jgi:hypothetical protein